MAQIDARKINRPIYSLAKYLELVLARPVVKFLLQLINFLFTVVVCGKNKNSSEECKRAI